MRLFAREAFRPFWHFGVGAFHLGFRQNLGSWLGLWSRTLRNETGCGYALQRLTQVRDVVRDIEMLLLRWGMRMDAPFVLNDAGNLMRPYPLVARVATLFSGDDPDFWRLVWQRDLRVAHHLMRHGIPVVAPATMVPAGPHLVAETWMTLWNYAEPVELPALGVGGLFLVQDLTHAMESFPERLPPWGAWIHVTEAIARLSSSRESRLADLLREIEVVRQRLEGAPLFPAHGDAHPGNLLPTSDGWRWIDFEDVSAMPRFWDLASFIANTGLLEGMDHPIVVQAYGLDDVMKDPETFWWVIRARVAMSLSTNMGLAWAGQGDRAFALRQWERWPAFLHEWTRNHR